MKTTFAHRTHPGGRSSNQDAIFVSDNFLKTIPNSSIFGVFDGHGTFGLEAARFARDELPRRLQTNEILARNSPQEWFLKSFEEVNRDLNATVDTHLSGTTALIAIVYENRLLLANLGDCQALLVRDGSHSPPYEILNSLGYFCFVDALILTIEIRLHNFSSKIESDRVIAAGGKIYRLDPAPDCTFQSMLRPL